MTFFDFMIKFPTEKAVIKYFLKIRYNDVLICPHCGSKVRVQHRNDNLKLCNKI